MTCFRCKKILTETPQPIAPFFKLVASLSLAPLHGGLWAWEEYSKDYCRSCRVKLCVSAVTLAAMVLAGVICALTWVMTKGLLPFRVGR